MKEPDYDFDMVVVWRHLDGPMSCTGSETQVVLVRHLMKMFVRLRNLCGFLREAWRVLSEK